MPENRAEIQIAELHMVHTIVVFFGCLHAGGRPCRPCVSCPCRCIACGDVSMGLDSSILHSLLLYCDMSDACLYSRARCGAARVGCTPLVCAPAHQRSKTRPTSIRFMTTAAGAPLSAPDSAQVRGLLLRAPSLMRAGARGRGPSWRASRARTGVVHDACGTY
jgi:hypothetical protein